MLFSIYDENESVNNFDRFSLANSKNSQYF